MNADEFRDYILGFIFYKYLSEKMEIFANEITFPFTENETCLILYQHISTIISGIILKILEPSMIVNYEINTNSQIEIQFHNKDT